MGEILPIPASLVDFLVIVFAQVRECVEDGGHSIQPVGIAAFSAQRLLGRDLDLPAFASMNAVNVSCLENPVRGIRGNLNHGADFSPDGGRAAIDLPHPVTNLDILQLLHAANLRRERKKPRVNRRHEARVLAHYRLGNHIATHRQVPSA